MSSVHATELVFLLLLLFVVAFGALARKLNTPYPIVMVVGGLLLSFAPRIPHIALNPDLVFLVILPPLLYSAAWVTSWREFSYNFVSIFLLAFGLVTFTIIGVAQAGQWLLPGFDWRVGLVLGAIVAPTDAIAASSIANRVGLPKRIVDILEGESLINDASALLALEFGIALLTAGVLPTFTGGLLRLCYLVAVGIVIGLLVGEVVHRVEHLVDDAPVEIALSILTPYVAYLAANSLRASGVLAVVSCGLYLSRKSSHFFSPNVRLQAWAVWDSLTFILNGVVFILIGLQLPYVLSAIPAGHLHTLLALGLAFSLLLIALRLIWVYPGAYAGNWIRRRLLHQREVVPSVKGIFVVGWTGMRGVISLAAAIALPQTLAGGVPFAQRNTIIFLAFCVILVTLVLQGLTLPPLIRGLGLAGIVPPDVEEREARLAILQAAMSHLELLRARESDKFADVYEDLAQHYRRRMATLADASGAPAQSRVLHRKFIDLSRELLRVQRQTAVKLRNQRQISDEVMRELERELDLGEAQLQAKSK